jgi:hypothetical protein
MRVSTIVTLLIGLAVGALLMSTLSTSGRGFSLQLCPIPPVATDSSNAALKETKVVGVDVSPLRIVILLVVIALSVLISRRRTWSPFGYRVTPQAMAHGVPHHSVGPGGRLSSSSWRRSSSESSDSLLTGVRCDDRRIRDRGRDERQPANRAAAVQGLRRP